MRDASATADGRSWQLFPCRQSSGTRKSEGLWAGYTDTDRRHPESFLIFLQAVDVKSGLMEAPDYTPPTEGGPPDNLRTNSLARLSCQWERQIQLRQSCPGLPAKARRKKHARQPGLALSVCPASLLFWYKKQAHDVRFSSCLGKNERRPREAISFF